MSDCGDCPICYEPYTGVQRKPVPCPGCGFAACVRCVKTGLLSSLTEPACLSCKRAWGRPFLDAHLTRTWNSGPLHEHRGAVLFDRERAMLPATQEAVAVERRRREAKAALAALELERIPHLRAVQATKAAVDVATPATTKKEIAAAKAAHRAAKEALSAFENNPRWHELRRMASTGRLPDADAAPVVVERAKFVAACPRGDCRGFLSTQYKCGTCDRHFCSKCREQKQEGHVCDPDLVATIAAIVADSRPCPSCATPISRVSGCDQMWCTECRTPFSYATGQRVSGVIHNPHYFQHRAALVADAGGNGDAADAAAIDACGDDAVDRRLDQILRSLQKHHAAVRTDLYDKIHNIRYRYADLGGWQLRNHRARSVVDNLHLRVSYMLNDIDEATFKKELAKSQRESEFHAEIVDVFETALGCMLDFFMAIPREWNGNPADYTGPLAELDAKLEPLINGPLVELAARYGRKCPVIVVSPHDAVYYWHMETISPAAARQRIKTTATAAAGARGIDVAATAAAAGGGK